MYVAWWVSCEGYNLVELRKVVPLSTFHVNTDKLVMFHLWKRDERIENEAAVATTRHFLVKSAGLFHQPHSVPVTTSDLVTVRAILPNKIVPIVHNF